MSVHSVSTLCRVLCLLLWITFGRVDQVVSGITNATELTIESSTNAQTRCLESGGMIRMPDENCYLQLQLGINYHLLVGFDGQMGVYTQSTLTKEDISIQVYSDDVHGCGTLSILYENNQFVQLRTNFSVTSYLEVISSSSLDHYQSAVGFFFFAHNLNAGTYIQVQFSQSKTPSMNLLDFMVALLVFVGSVGILMMILWRLKICYLRYMQFRRSSKEPINPSVVPFMASSFLFCKEPCLSLSDATPLLIMPISGGDSSLVTVAIRFPDGSHCGSRNAAPAWSLGTAYIKLRPRG